MKIMRPWFIAVSSCESRILSGRERERERGPFCFLSFPSSWRRKEWINWIWEAWFIFPRVLTACETNQSDLSFFFSLSLLLLLSFIFIWSERRCSTGRELQTAPRRTSFVSSAFSLLCPSSGSCREKKKRKKDTRLAQHPSSGRRQCLLSSGHKEEDDKKKRRRHWNSMPPRSNAAVELDFDQGWKRAGGGHAEL